MQMQFQRRLSRRLQALMSYTWSHSIDIASNDSANLSIPASLNASIDRGPSDFDVRHAFNGAVSYDIPFKDIGRIGNAIMRDWSIDSIVTARSATPVNVIYTKTVPAIGSLSLRPDLILG